jgi:hydrogenase nickel incorporation protein HypB
VGSLEQRRIRIERELLEKNSGQAARNRAWLAGRGILTLNLLGGPGAGKTTLLERTLVALRGEVPVAVIEGDQETDRDAARLRDLGCPVLQINTGTGCHLDASSVARGLETLAPPPRSLLVVENVGNLVCPALFDLGEHAKVVLLSVTEGEDKPLKYPHVFMASQLFLIGKTDLVPHLQVDVPALREAALRVNPRLRVLPVSSTRSDGLDAWLDWLRGELRRVAATAPEAAGSSSGITTPRPSGWA